MRQTSIFTIIMIGTLALLLASCRGNILIMRERIHRRFDNYSIVVSGIDRLPSKSEPEKQKKHWIAWMMFPSHDRGKEVVRGDTFSLANVNFRVAGFLPGVKRNSIVLSRRPR